MNSKVLLLGVGLVMLVAVGYFALMSPQTEQVISETNNEETEVGNAMMEIADDVVEADDEAEGVMEYEEVEDEYVDTQVATEVMETQTQTEEESVSEGYTLAEVALHNTEEDCWSAVNGKVYDVSAFFGKHPGGDKNLFRICGIDGTAAFNGQHGGDAKPERTLEGFYIGDLAQ